MGHIVINKRRILLVLSLLVSISVFGQEQQTEPYFNYKNTKSTHLSKLHYFLGTFTPVKLNKCVFASGIFRFKIAKDGKISDFQVSGNLPDSLVYTIKERIFQTESYWCYSSKTDFASKWFVLPVFVDRGIGKDCKDNKSIEENYSWIYKLFDKSSKIIMTPTSYLLLPFYLSAIN